MMPEPMTVASSRPVPSASAAIRCALHATLGLGEVLPSVRPMSRRRLSSANRFSDATGRPTSSETRFLR